MSALPRGKCMACKADVALRKGGLVREHRDHRHELFGAPGRRPDEVPVCPGSGLPSLTSRSEV